MTTGGLFQIGREPLHWSHKTHTIRNTKNIRATRLSMLPVVDNKIRFTTETWTNEWYMYMNTRILQPTQTHEKLPQIHDQNRIQSSLVATVIKWRNIYAPCVPQKALPVMRLLWNCHMMTTRAASIREPYTFDRMQADTKQMPSGVKCWTSRMVLFSANVHLNGTTSFSEKPERLHRMQKTQRQMLYLHSYCGIALRVKCQPYVRCIERIADDATVGVSAFFLCEYVFPPVPTSIRIWLW